MFLNPPPHTHTAFIILDVISVCFSSLGNVCTMAAHVQPEQVRHRGPQSVHGSVHDTTLLTQGVHLYERLLPQEDTKGESATYRATVGSPLGK